MKRLSNFLNLRYSIFAFGLSLVFFSYTTSIHAQCVGDVTISSQSQVDNFNCTILNGDLTISGDDINNLNGLSELTSVDGWLEIVENASLTNVEGLSALTSVDGSLYIWDNEALTNVDGLAVVTSVGHDLYIVDNDALTNIDGLAALTKVGSYDKDDLSITNNDILIRCCGLYPLLMYGTVSGVINIDNRPNGCTYDDILYGGVCPDTNTLLTFYDARVSEGMIYGTETKPLKNVEKFKKILEKANNFSEEDKTEPCCGKLIQGYTFIDGIEKDLIEGESVDNLSEMIEEIMINMYCY